MGSVSGEVKTKISRHPVSLGSLSSIRDKLSLIGDLLILLAVIAYMYDYILRVRSYVPLAFWTPLVATSAHSVAGRHLRWQPAASCCSMPQHWAMWSRGGGGGGGFAACRSTGF